ENALSRANGSFLAVGSENPRASSEGIWPQESWIGPVPDNLQCQFIGGRDDNGKPFEAFVCGEAPFGGGVGWGSGQSPYKSSRPACETGVFHTTVTNNTNRLIPLDAVITVHGVEAPWTLTSTLLVPLAPGASRTFPGCPDNVRTCRATAKWENP